MEGFKKSEMLNFLLLVVGVLFLLGCEPKGPQNRVNEKGQVALPFDGEIFALFAHPKDEKGLRKISVIDHGAGRVATFSQTTPQVWRQESQQDIGFHPGVMKIWPQSQELTLFAAEGDNAVKLLQYGNQFTEHTTIEERSPRYVSYFNWPYWGPSVAVSPYLNGYLTLLKGVDPLKGRATERVVVPLADSVNTIRSAERVTVGDIDGDGIDELVLVYSATGEVAAVTAAKDKPGAAPTVKLLHANKQWGMPNEAQLIDLDEDGDLDIILPDEAPPGKINLLKNDGHGHFTEEAPLEFPGQFGIVELRVGKDQDGLAYMFAAGNGFIAIYQRPRDWSFGQGMPLRQIPWTNNITHDMIFDDLDGDGWLDGVIGKASGKNPLWVVHGPLWEQFGKLAEQGFVLQ
jgi:hypothetical protein